MKTSEQLLIAQTIIDQLGGSGRLMAMIGIWNIRQENNGVSFRFRGSQIANYVKITLNNDTYTLEFMLINPCKNLCEQRESFSDVYNEMLKSMFEDYTSLRLSL